MTSPFINYDERYILQLLHWHFKWYSRTCDHYRGVAEFLDVSCALHASITGACQFITSNVIYKMSQSLSFGKEWVWTVNKIFHNIIRGSKQHADSYGLTLISNLPESQYLISRYSSLVFHFPIIRSNCTAIRNIFIAHHHSGIVAVIIPKSWAFLDITSRNPQKDQQHASYCEACILEDTVSQIYSRACAIVHPGQRTVTVTVSRGDKSATAVTCLTRWAPWWETLLLFRTTLHTAYSSHVNRFGIPFMNSCLNEVTEVWMKIKIFSCWCCQLRWNYYTVLYTAYTRTHGESVYCLCMTIK